MEHRKIYIINKRIILDLKLCIWKYLVLMLIVESEKKYKTFHKGNWVYYSELKGIDIAKELHINPSTVSRHINHLKASYCIDKTKFGYSTFEYIEKLFSEISDNESILFHNDSRLFEFCKTPEQILISLYLWNEFFLKSRDLKKIEIYTNLPVDKKTVDNTIEYLENNQTIRIWKNKIMFSEKAKKIFSDVISENDIKY